MSKNKILFVVLGALVLIYLGNKFLRSNNERNFKDYVVQLDTAAVTRMVIRPKANNHEPISVVKEGKGWSVSSGDVKDEADKNSIRGMLSSMISLKPIRLVANSEEKWKQYEVNDSLGTQVQMYAGEELLADVMIGKFSFNQAARTAATFVRLTDEDEIYTVDGFLSSTYNQDFNGFRNKIFIKTVPENITSISFQYQGDSSFRMDKLADKWQINGQQVDSAAVRKYVNGLRILTQREFVDGFTASGDPNYKLTIDGNNMSTVNITGYQDGEDIILHSSLNDNAYFKKGNLNVFEKLFVSSTLFKKEGL